MSLAVTTREYTSISHIQTAALMCRQTRVAQDAWLGTGPTFDEIGWQAIIGNAVSTVFGSVAFVEAGVNEFLKDCAEGKHGEPSRKAIDQDLRRQIGALWAPSVKQRWSPRTKWRRILALDSKAPKTDLEQDWDFVCVLRNGLVHSQPEDVTVTSTIPEIPQTKHSLAELCNSHFAPNPKVRDAGSYFLWDWLAHPCAEWVFGCALAYSDHLWGLLGAPTPYEHVRARLVTR